ncbi:glycoside hydrolase family 3 N-terminal domain-containing protein [Vagococcus fessus]|uniref:Fibronectin type III-like domain-containing protein n=1 Tax=Vagococcus fessus TaxID=120370 RepID=A0A430A7D9_9ENTE|nr:glycoside hydrolase family 3 N-terminal domain-containing protein [Vagococcus fessus]RSU03022.1 hypothetical protein CBF31_04655 [Vagococcus fessus]
MSETPLLIESRAISLYQGLENSEIDYNKELYDFYQNSGFVKKEGNDVGLVQVAKGMISPQGPDEPEIDYLDDKTMKQAAEYSDQAMIVINSAGVEAKDLEANEIRLTANKKELIKKVSKYFDNITLVVNAGNTYELGFIDEFDAIKSVVWVGVPGPFGMNSLGKVVAGDLNPSGRLADTMAYDITNNPASKNFGDYKYDNSKMAFINYQENIYIGYRYYETAYADDEEAYRKEVQFPYGYGLSYTDFEWKVTKKSFDKEKLSLDVEVTNKGDSAGKDVVELYFTAPYTKGGIEKSAIELATYAKTNEIKPGEKETVSLSFDTKDLSSYDMTKGAYVLEKGNYNIKLAKNVHEIVETLPYKVDEIVIYDKDETTGVAYKNRFEHAAGEEKQLSRADFKGTYPNPDELSYTAPQYALDKENKEITETKGDMPTVGKDNGIKLEELKGLDYDDPKWEEFLDQLTLEEMQELVTNGAYKTVAIDRLGVPKSVLMDSPAGLSFFFKKVEAAAYPGEVVIASTWNDELAKKMGEAVGKEARAYGVQGWYAPGMNLHRTALGGRNFEYFSEDPVLTGNIVSSMIKGAQDQGVIVFMKHFVLNDQETNARSGIYVWANEQAMRELYLRPFEMAVKQADVHGVMSSFSLVNTKWSGGNPELLNDVLRGEWGFEGVVSTDAVFGFMEAQKAIVSGNDLMLDVMSVGKNNKRIDKAYKKDPVGITQGLRTSSHHILHTLLKTYLFE